jgi:PAS domain S-box-containing protein
MVTVSEPTMNQDLQEANARLRLLIESVQGGLTIIEDRRVVYVSNQLCQILGYSREELGHMSEVDLAAPEERERLEQAFRETELKGLPLEELEFWAVRKDGNRRYVRNRYATGMVGTGVPFRFVVTLDLTERELARQAVIEQDALLQQILDASQALAAADDPEAMLRAIAEPAMRATPGTGSGAHMALLMFIDVDAEGRPEWASVVASVGEAAVPAGIRFYLPGTSPTDFLLSSPDRPLLVADMRASMEGLNEHVARMMDSIHARAFAALPLRADRRWQGMVVLAWPEIHEFRAEEERLYQLLASELTGRVQGLRQQQEAEHRAKWSQTAAEVSRAASTVLEMEDLLQQVVDLVQARFDLYYAGLFLVAQEEVGDGESGNWAVLQVGTGEAGQQMVEQGHKLEIGGESMIGQSVATSQPRIAMDVGEEAVRFANPLLPDTRTELALPLVSRGQALGALTIQSRQQAAFSVDDIAVLQTMADQLAITIDNANLIEQAQGRAERERRVRAIADQIHRGASAEVILGSTLTELSQLLGASKSVIHLGTRARLRAELGELRSEEG